MVLYLGADDADLRLGRGLVLDRVRDDAHDRALALGGRLGEGGGAGGFFGGELLVRLRFHLGVARHLFVGRLLFGGGRRALAVGGGGGLAAVCGRRVLRRRLFGVHRRLLGVGALLGVGLGRGLSARAGDESRLQKERREQRRGVAEMSHLKATRMSRAARDAWMTNPKLCEKSEGGAVKGP